MKYARATVEGFCTNDFVLKTSKTGKHFCTFTMAINHYDEPDVPPKVSYISIEAWEKIAVEIKEKVSKGKRVFVSGTVIQDIWEGKDEKIQTKIKIVADVMRVL